MFLLNWLVNHRWFCHIRWGGLSDHFTHPLDEAVDTPIQGTFF